MAGDGFPWNGLNGKLAAVTLLWMCPCWGVEAEAPVSRQTVSISVTILPPPVYIVQELKAGPFTPIIRESGKVASGSALVLYRIVTPQ